MDEYAFFTSAPLHAHMWYTPDAPLLGCAPGVVLMPLVPLFGDMKCIDWVHEAQRICVRNSSGMAASHEIVQTGQVLPLC